MGQPYVGIRADKWEDVVARRIVSNELNRERALAIVQFNGKVDAASKTIDLLRKDVTDERALKNEARAERDQFAEANGKLTKKLKRRTPWATAMKVQVGAIVVFGGYQAYKAIVP